MKPARISVLALEKTKRRKPKRCKPKRRKAGFGSLLRQLAVFGEFLINSEFNWE